MQITTTPVVSEANGSYLAVSPDSDGYRVGVVAETEDLARSEYAAAVRRARDALTRKG